MELQANTLDLTKAELRALLAHASTDPAREALCAIYVEPGACPPRVFAVDGHRAAICVAQCADRVGSHERTAIGVPRAPLDQAVRLAGGTGRTIRLRIGPREDAPDQGPSALGAPAGVVSVEVLDQHGAPTGAAFWAKRSDITPPDIDAVIPTPDPTPGVRAAYVHLDPAYLADVRHVVAAAESDPHPHATMAGIRLYSPTGAETPVAFSAGAWAVVIMPTKGKEGGEVRSTAPRPAPKPKAPEELPAATVKAKGRKGRKAA
jgi:hypothetical protein